MLVGTLEEGYSDAILGADRQRIESGPWETVAGLKNWNFVGVDVAVFDGNGACEGTAGGGQGYTHGRRGLKVVEMTEVGGIGRVVSQKA